MLEDQKLHTSVDHEIFSYLDLDSPKSFFLFAGAGSGKTRTLVNVLQQFKEKNGNSFQRSGKKIAVITYTNAACDEIKYRLGYEEIFTVSTIHSFAWNLIKTFQVDIKEWIEADLKKELVELHGKASRAGTKAETEKIKKIELKSEKLKCLNEVKCFTYNPNGENNNQDSINHAQVIKIAASFLFNKPLMQSILIQKFPILLIDESQDTKKELLEAFFKVAENNPSRFCLGLFGDTMQRIYVDGKPDLGDELPSNWAKPVKLINYRCPTRILKLINKIRSDVDSKKQNMAENSAEGFARLFIVDTSKKDLDKNVVEKKITMYMADICKDNNWTNLIGVKVLILEHHMAAVRNGFKEFFSALYGVEKLRTGLLDGSLQGVSFFTQQILPLVKAKFAGNEFSVASLAKKYSPLLSKEVLKEAQDPHFELKRVNNLIDEFYQLWTEKKDPILREILLKISHLNLFIIPDILQPLVSGLVDTKITIEKGDRDEILEAWEKALLSPFSQIIRYNEYISEHSQFGTHQGVKGLEFPRVMVILDDEEAKGFLFSYEKLLGAKVLSDTDRENLQNGKEISLDRTRRLFYVTCSRAKESLAIVAYTNDAVSVKNHILNQKWFESSEIIVIE